MIDGFEMVAKRFAANGNAVLDHFRRLTQGEGIALDRVGRVGEFDVVVFLELHQGSHRQRAQAVELRLLLPDRVDESFKHRRQIAYY